MKHYYKKFIFIIFLLFSSFCYGQKHNGILGIYANTLNGTRGGTAFIISDSNDIVTAYHVVENATSISLQEEGKGAIQSANILVRAIDVKRDIAILTVPSLSIRKTMQFKDRFPSTLENLKVVGYPRNMPNAVISAKAIKEGPVLPSNSAFRVSQGPLLNGDIDLIALEMIIYGGLSGAPLIDKDNLVIGLVSGSLNEGGSYAWALPISNVSNLLAKPSISTAIGKFAWPKLELLSPYAKSTTRSYKNSANSFELQVKYKETFNKYLRSTEELRSSIVISGEIHDRVCSSMQYQVDYANSHQKTFINTTGGLFISELRSARNVANDYMTTLNNRVVNSKIIRSYMNNIYNLPYRDDFPSNLKEPMKDALAKARLAEPEQFSKTFEEIYLVDVNLPQLFLRNIDSILLKSSVSISDASDFSNQCFMLFKDIKKFKKFTNNANDLALAYEVKIYTGFSKFNDLFSDYLAFQ